MGNVLFESAWRKWSWGCDHAEAFEADIERFANNTDPKPFLGVRADYHPHRHAFALVVDQMFELPLEWGLRLGDVAFNWRCALDHLAWAIVGRGRTPPHTLSERQRKSIYFPIKDRNEDFSQEVGTLLPGATRRDIATVRRYQPYSRCPKQKLPLQCLTILSRLNNDDKHRQLQPVPVYPDRGAYEVTEQRNCIVTESLSRQYRVPPNVGAELGTIRVRKTGPQPELKVQVVFDTLVSLDNRVPVVNWMDTTAAWIGALLLEFSNPPPDLGLGEPLSLGHRPDALE